VIEYVNSAIYLWAKNKKAFIWLVNTHKKYAEKLDAIIEEREVEIKNR